MSASLALALMFLTPASAPADEPVESARQASDDWLEDEDEDERRSKREARRRRAAVDACRDEALAEAEGYGLFGRVGRIDGVDQSGRRFRVRGVFVDESHPRHKRSFRFMCIAGREGVESFGYRDPIRRPL